MSDTAIVERIPQELDAVFERVIMGDLEGLSPRQRVLYVQTVCTETGLNWKTHPFAFIRLNGKLTMYATKNCTDQLRKIYGVSTRIAGQERIEDVLVVTVETTDNSGRQDMDIGAVTIGNLRGDALANAMMKAITKAKRRATLSICGLGMLDESEIETIPGAQRVTFNDEMDQADRETRSERTAPPNARQMPDSAPRQGFGSPSDEASVQQIKYIHALAREAGWGHDDVHNATVWWFEVEGIPGLTRQMASSLVERLQQKPPRPVHPDQQPLDMSGAVPIEAAGRPVDPETGEVLPANGDAENGFWDLDGSLLPPVVTGDPSQDIRAVEAAAADAWDESQIAELSGFVRHHGIGDDTLVEGLRERYRELAAKNKKRQ